MKRIFLGLLLLGIFAAILIPSLFKEPYRPPLLSQLREKYHKKASKSADHSKFLPLQKPFTRPQEVTEACISCHNQRHIEVMKSSHWNWERLEYVTGKGIRAIGKKNILNNFCIGIASNEAACNKCHIGFGFKDASFDFQNPLNVDCLSCHDLSNTYLKASGGAGMPDPSVNLNIVAQSVGRPTRNNCGTCHFFGGGGNNVKHGDLEMALFDTEREIDVHMGTDGVDLSCVDCHTAKNHQMLGKVYSLSSMNRDRVQCEQCHTDKPHQQTILNRHGIKVACQTCHIPTYAKVNPTKMEWDWSTAGNLKNGEPYEEKDSLGMVAYTSLKGTFTWARNVKPEYLWFNGTATHVLLGEPINPTQVVKINELFGSYRDPEAKIIPVKIHRAVQPYDKKYNYLVQPKTYSVTKGDSGFWNDFDWQKAIQAGMQHLGLPYSGDYGFVKTEMTWPINHMVAPKSQALSCVECHSRENSRLAALTDFYLPARDRNYWIDHIGKGLIIFTIIAVILHTLLRIYHSTKNQARRDV
ncbi:MAG: tetrathionate reductase family octaheme c-type cytochrome [bacterium]|nr:tetrathionate reductase family octaheme c-type cytochrome [bacterium]